MQKISTKFRWYHPSGGIGKNCIFNWSRSLQLRYLIAENLCPSDTVVCVHDAVLAEEYTVLSTTLLVAKLVGHSYDPIHINKVGCMEVC